MLLAYVRTILLYLVLILSVRLMGKRQVGQLETSEFVVAMVMAGLAAGRPRHPPRGGAHAGRRAAPDLRGGAPADDPGAGAGIFLFGFEKRGLSQADVRKAGDPH